MRRDSNKCMGELDAPEVSGGEIPGWRAHRGVFLPGSGSVELGRPEKRDGKEGSRPHYLLVAYSPGWIGKALEIEFVFKERRDGTEVSVKWPYAREIPLNNESPTEFHRQEEERKRKTERLIERFKSRIGATDLSTS
jgi:hypothetical protein